MGLFGSRESAAAKLRQKKDIDGLITLCHREPKSQSEVVDALAAFLEEGGNITASYVKERSVGALFALGHGDVVLRFLQRFFDEKDERNGLGYLAVFDAACASVLSTKDLPAIRQLLTFGMFEYDRVSSPYKLVDLLKSEDELLELYLLTRSGLARKEICSRLGDVGGAKALALLTAVAEKGLQRAIDDLGRPDAIEAVANTWVAMGGAGVFKLYAQEMFRNDFEQSFKKDAEKAVRTLNKRIGPT